MFIDTLCIAHSCFWITPPALIAPNSAKPLDEYTT